MSDYSRSKVIRMISIEDCYELRKKFSELFGISEINKFEVAPTEEPFIDYVLEYSYGEDCGDFGFVRYLTEKELEKFIPIFSEINPEVKPEDLRVVDYCFYNCSEAPGYFEVEELA